MFWYNEIPNANDAPKIIGTFENNIPTPRAHIEAVKTAPHIA